MTIVYLSMGALSLSLFFAAGPVVSFFGLTPAAARMAVEVLRWCSVFTAVFWPMSFVLPNALRAAGDARFTMIVSMFSMWVFRIAFAYLFVRVFQLGVMGVWYGMFIDWIFRAAVFSLRFHGLERRAVSVS